MSEYELDLRDVAPPKRHPTIMKAFEEMERGETLTLVNDHEPKPLYYQMKEEVETFDAEAYEVEKEEQNKFVAQLPKN
ncbi:MAG: hypothetical protein ACI9QA_000115 [Methanobacteriota archaeon]|jgi:uncharacterized protein (DUF2249 family)|uniref:DUF2249 domain-containing protein n=1 Tax=Halorutilus salinus TaxID=2487751 RepID=A0A9Q4C5M2_9EURY|nr:DUF2249 domain-containing protein [Halorutilus salinus]MCX2819703.1 DUF2249 domain-containing protein [Halorutilus salinus]